jgi:hypothetical protein
MNRQAIKELRQEMHTHQQVRLAVHFTRGAHRFEIFQTPSRRGLRYLGYFDGQFSVAARDGHTAARMLLRRHVPRSRAVVT